MDNLTHSLTGALAAKLIRQEGVQDSGKRILFWLFVVSANLPDLDVLMQLFTDRLTYIVHHRGISHSLVFAPVFALVPAWLWFRTSSVKRFGLLWSVSLIGIVLHICFDLVTSFGTKLLAPFSDKRFALDWMFIIDPFFTLLLVAPLALGKLLKRRALQVTRMVAVLSLLYLGVEAASHAVAIAKIRAAVHHRSIDVRSISALPQPFSIFSWNGLVQTEKGVHQVFFTVFDDSVRFTDYTHSSSPRVAEALEQDVVLQYFSFARHPWITLRREGETEVVEIMDLQFSIDEGLLRRFGMADMQRPFVLRMEFSQEGKLAHTLFDGRKLPL